jgi:hypothetical protein
MRMSRIRATMTRPRRLAATILVLGAVASPVIAAPSLGPKIAYRAPSAMGQADRDILLAAATDVAEARIPRTRPAPDSLNTSEREARTFHDFPADSQLAAALGALDSDAMLKLAPWRRHIPIRSRHS